MSDFFDIIFSFPTVIFTVASAIFLSFWTITTLLGVGADALDGLDLDFDADADVDVDVDAGGDLDVGTDAGLLVSALHFMGLTRVPLLLGLSLLSLFGWVASALAMAVLGNPTGIARTLLGIAVGVGAFLFGIAATRVIGKRLEGVFESTTAPANRDLVGSTCKVTTLKVTGDFGQAEIETDAGLMLVQVRCSKPNDLGAGDHALIFDHNSDNGVFHIAPDRMPAA